MAYHREYDVYEHAEIERNEEGEIEVTEVRDGGLHTYKLDEILSRWVGIKNVTITIETERHIPSAEEGDSA